MRRFGPLSTFTVVLMVSLAALGQHVSHISMKEIEKNVKDTSSNYLYSHLVARFLTFDEHLTHREYEHLYYGSAVQKAYPEELEIDASAECLKDYHKGNFPEAIEIGQSALKNDPTNLKLLVVIANCYSKMRLEETGYHYYKMYFRLLETILSSGDGLTEKTAYIVLHDDDKYQIVNELKLKISGEIFITDRLDVVTIDTSTQKNQKGKRKIDRLYFDTSRNRSVNPLH